MTRLSIDKIGWFRLAKNAAIKSSHPYFKIGAVVCNKKPIAFGWNQFEKSHPGVEPWGVGRRHRLCAERHACIGLSDRDLAGSTFYICRITPGGKIAISKPCPSCIMFLKEKNIKRVYFTIDDGYDMIKI